MKNTYLTSLSLLAFVSSVITAPGAILVYEGFNYGTASATRDGADLLDGQADGSGGDVDATGLGGAWVDSAGPSSSSNLFLSTGSLSFGGLATSGNHVRSDTNSNNDLFSRSITATMPTSGQLWLGFLGNKLQNDFSAAEGGITVGNQAVNNTRVLLDTGSTGMNGFGIAPTTAGNDWTAYAWNGTTQVDVGATLGVAANGSETNLLIAKLSFGTGAGGLDEFGFYYYDLTKSGGSVISGESNLTQVGSTLDVDFDQAAFDTLSLTRQVNTAYDEIRIGTELDDALGLTVVPEPSSAILGAIGALLLLRRRRD